MSAVVTEVSFTAPVYEGLDGFRLARYVRDQSNLKGTARAIAYILAIFYYNTRDGLAFPSTETLAKDAGLTRRTVFNALTALRASGEWVIVPGAGKRRDVIRSVMPTVMSSIYYPVLDHDALPEGVTLKGFTTITVTTTTHEPLPAEFYDVEPPVETEMAPPPSVEVMA